MSRILLMLLLSSFAHATSPQSWLARFRSLDHRIVPVANLLAGRYQTAMIWERTNQQHTEKYVNLLADIKRIQRTYTPLAGELNQTMEEFVREKDQFLDEATPEQRLRLFGYIEEIKKATSEKEKEFDIWQKASANTQQ